MFFRSQCYINEQIKIEVSLPADDAVMTLLKEWADSQMRYSEVSKETWLFPSVKWQSLEIFLEAWSWGI